MKENQREKMPLNNSLDDLFRSAIEPLEEHPSAAVWESVEHSLDRHNVINIKRKYNNLKRIAIVLVLVLSSALIYEFQIRDSGYNQKQAGIRIGRDAISGKNIVTERSHEAENVAGSIKPGQQQLTDDEPSAGSIKNEDTIAGKNAMIFSARHRQENILSSVWGNDASGNTQSKMPGKTVSSSLPERRISAYDRYASKPIQDNQKLSLRSRFPSSMDLVQYEDMLTATHVVSINVAGHKQFPDLKKIKTTDSSNNLAMQAVKLSGRRSRFSLGFIFSPDFNSRMVKADWPINREDNRDEIRRSERYAFSYSLGAEIDYTFHKHWVIQSGFTLSRTAININPKFIFARPDDLGDVKYKFNSSSGYSYLSPHSISRPAFGDSLHTLRSSSSLIYASVPVAVKYKVTRRKFDYHISAGIAANILIKDKIETSLVGVGGHENTINHDIRGLKPVYYNSLLAAGVSYHFNRSVAVHLSPTFRLGITSINKEAPVKSYQQSLGLVTGVQINF